MQDRSGTKGCVIMGGTDTVNMSYPDHFRIFQRKNQYTSHESVDDTIESCRENEPRLYELY